ncbi:hypothetical protein ACX93W_06200 [Paenibacillus sp. CAU 1782]
MKKLLLVMTAVSTLLLSACGAAQNKNENTGIESKETESAATESATPTEAAKEENSAAVEVDKGLFSNEVTLPASMFEGQDFEQIVAQAKEEGIGEVIQNDDGSITYKMSKSAYKTMMDEMEQGLLDYVNELKSGTDFASIKDVTHNKSFSEFTLIVDKAAYESGFDGMASLGIVVAASYYQLFNGVSSDDLKITINAQDESTKEVFSTRVFPEALEQ